MSHKQQAGPNSEGNKNSGDKNVNPAPATTMASWTSGSSDDNRLMDFYNNEKCGASAGIINGGMNFESGNQKTGSGNDNPSTRVKKVNGDPSTRVKKVNGDPSTRVKKVNDDPKTGKTIESDNQKTGSRNDNRIMSFHNNKECGVSTGTINDGMNF